MQLGTLYPFARQHSNINNIRKEPYAFGETMLTTSLKALEFRYKVLKHYYALFINTQGTGTIYKPVFFEFHNDSVLLDNEYIFNHQFMIGTELLVIPNMEEGKDVIEGYFPKATWYDLRNDEMVSTGMRNITAGLNDTAPIFLREGKTIFTQNVENVESSSDLNDEFNLLVALSNGGLQKSEGAMLALNEYNNKNHVEGCMKNDCKVKIVTMFDTEKNELTIKIAKPSFVNEGFSPLKLNKVKVFGIDGVAKYNNHFVSRLKMGGKYFVGKVKAETTNDHTIELNFKDSITVGENDIEVSIRFF